MAEVDRRISFGDTSLHQPEFLDIHEVLQAASSPSVEQFRRQALVSLPQASGRHGGAQLDRLGLDFPVLTVACANAGLCSTLTQPTLHDLCN